MLTTSKEPCVALSVKVGVGADRTEPYVARSVKVGVGALVQTGQDRVLRVLWRVTDSNQLRAKTLPCSRSHNNL